MCLFAMLLTACSAKKPASEAAAPAAVDLDEYVGRYDSGSYDTVVIEKQGDGYTMSVGLYRLTSLDEGTVTASPEGVVFETKDVAGNPMTLCFYRDGESFTLRVEESTWPNLKKGTLVEDLKPTTAEALAASVGTPDEEGTGTVLPPEGEGQIGLQAVVLCETLTVRQGPSTASEAVGTLQYGDRLLVYRETNGWAECFVSDDVDATPIGWVKTDYLLIDPAWYRTTGTTPVYAWNDTSAPKVALLSKNTTLPILKDEGEWIIVSLRGAAGWIRAGAH